MIELLKKIKNKFLTARPIIVSEAEKLIFYKNLIPNNSLIFDVGANVGNRIDTFLEISSSIVAIEPQPQCVEVLKEKYQAKIQIEQVGLSDNEGILEMYIANESTISTFSKEFIEKVKESRFSRNNWNEKMNVAVTTLDKLINKHGEPFFCKIDVEGFELNVLKGLSKSIPLISIEYCVPELSLNLYDCLHYLFKLDNNLAYNFSTGESMKLSLDKWLTYQDFLKVVKTKEFEKTLFGDIYIKKGI